MRRLVALVAAFAIVGSQAWAFDHAPEAVGQVYFRIPLGAAPKQAAAPHVGFRVAYGEGSGFDDRDRAGTYRELDLRLGLDGETELWVNGVDVSQLPMEILPAGDSGQSERSLWTGVGIAAIVGVVVLIGVGGALVIGRGGGGGGGNNSGGGVVIVKD